MRKILMLAVSSILLALLAPASALAHHLEQDTSSLKCELIGGGVPAIIVNAHYVDFSPWDQPVFWSVTIDHVRVAGGALTWSGPDYRHVATFQTTPGTHDVVYQATWNQGDNGGYLRRSLVCPQPPPPPPPTPPTTPPSPPAAPPAPPAPPVVPTQPVAGNEAAPCVKPAKSRFRLIDTPPMNSIDHGHVTFRVRGPHIKWVRFHVDHRWAKTDRSHPFKIGLWLWQTNVWGPALWGPHTISATIRTKCGTVRLSIKRFNHDPPILASAARSSWG